MGKLVVNGLTTLTTQKMKFSKKNSIKVQSCRSSNNKYMITSTQIRNPEIFAIIAVLVFNLLSRKALFISSKDNRNC